MMETNTIALTEEEVKILYDTLYEHLGDLVDPDVEMYELGDEEIDLISIFNKVEKIRTQIIADLGEFDPDKDADYEDAEDDNENSDD